MIGPLVSVDEVCEAVESTLTAWLPSVLAEIAAAKSLTLPVPTAYDMPDAAALRNDRAALPALAVSSPGLASPPVRDGDGVYEATWRVVVTAFARADSYRATARAVRGYALAVRTCLVQHQDLGGIAAHVGWVGEEYAALDSRVARTLGAGFVTFTVTVPGVSSSRGPLTPPVPPASLLNPADPQVASATVYVHPEA